MNATRYSAGDRIYDREDGELGRIVRVLSGAAVDYCTPVYEIVWAHAPGEQAMGSRCYADEIGPADELAHDCEPCVDCGRPVYWDEPSTAWRAAEASHDCFLVAGNGGTLPREEQ